MRLLIVSGYICSVLMCSELYSASFYGTNTAAFEENSSRHDFYRRQLEISDKKYVRDVLRSIKTDDERVIRLLESIWNKSGAYNNFSNKLLFDDPVIRLMLARKLYLYSKDRKYKYADFIKSKAYSRNWIIRSNAAEALGVIKDNESVDLLYQIALTPHNHVALQAIRALGLIAMSGAYEERIISYLGKIERNHKSGDIAEEISTIKRMILNRDSESEFISYDRIEKKYPYKGEINKLMRKAMDGDPQAQHLLGERFLLGLEVVRDYKKAKKWLLKSVNQNYAPAKVSLANAYLSGSCVEYNRKKAIELLESAKLQGSSDAYELLKILNDGRGHPQK